MCLVPIKRRLTQRERDRDRNRDRQRERGREREREKRKKGRESIIIAEKSSMQGHAYEKQKRIRCLIRSPAPETIIGVVETSATVVQLGR